MKVAICDDRELAVSIIKKKLEGWRDRIDDLEIVEFYTASELLNCYDNKGRFDLIFMDIDIEERGIGITAAQTIKAMDPDVLLIYITAYVDYVTQAMETEPFQYLPKTQISEKFDRQFGRAYERYSLMHKMISVPTETGEILHLRAIDIIYVESLKKKVVIHTKQDTFQTNYKLYRLKEKLPKAAFVQCHKSYLFNKRHFLRIEERMVVLLGTTEKIPIGLTYFPLVVD